MREFVSPKRQVVFVVALLVCGVLANLSGVGVAWAVPAIDPNKSEETSTSADDTTHKVPKSAGFSPFVGQGGAVPEAVQEHVHYRPMVTLRGVSDSQQIKKMLRSMITSQVSTMYQTMMMVDNGAAAGFTESMHTVSNLIGNATQAAQLELVLKGITDRTGAEQLGYANAIHRGMAIQNPDQGRQNILTGLAYASGDRLDGDDLNSGETIRQEPTLHSAGGSSKFEAVSGTAMGTGSSTAPSEILLSEILWTKEALRDNPWTTDPGERLVGSPIKFQTDFIGDLKITLESSGALPFTKDSNEMINATEQVENKANPGEKLYGFYARKLKRKESAWFNLYLVMRDYCEFKANNVNRSKPVFEKLSPGNVFDPSRWRKVSSPSFKWTVNLVDIFFKTWIETRSQDPASPTKVKCDFRGKEDPDISMPDEYKQPDANFDNCETNPKQCSRNKAMVRLVDLVADDVVINEFKNWHEAAINSAMAHHPWVLIELEKLVCSSLRGDRKGGEVLCDANSFLEDRAVANRQRWTQIVEDLGQVAQNAVGSTAFRPSPNSVWNDTGGNMETN